MRVHSPQGGFVLYERQAQLLAFVEARWKATREWPSHAEMREHMGWKTDGSVNDCLAKIAWRGGLRRVGMHKYEVIEDESRPRFNHPHRRDASPGEGQADV